MPFQQAPKVKLSDGHEIPILGLGTWQAAPGEVYKAVCHAIDVGYRHFDCALCYGNEQEVGKAIRDKIAAGVIKREDLFVTSKCWNTFHRREHVKESFNKTMADLDIGYLDLWLMHWPMSFQYGESLFPLDSEGNVLSEDIDYVETWQGMEDVFAEGRIRSLGVSNFNEEQLSRVLEICKVKPVMNQVEGHPYLAQTKLREFCEERGIKLTAYCPLGSPDRPWAKSDDPSPLQSPVVKEIGEKYKKTPAAVLLRFQIDRGVVVIPKSVNPERIEANLNIFDFQLSSDDIKQLEALDQGFRFCAFVQTKNCSHYPFQ